MNTLMLAINAPATALAGDACPAPAGQARVEWVGQDHPARREVEHFISEVFLHTYGARLTHFAQLLLAARNREGMWVAALGVTMLASREAWLEHYLDQPIEAVLSAQLGQGVAREQIAEVGNLAALNAGASRALIALASRYLATQGIPWVAFTATRTLFNAIARLNLPVRELSKADPQRLPDGGAGWGRYYDTQPMVMVGDIRGAMLRLDAGKHAS